MICDAVFEGGGVKGVAFIGAIQEAEARGYIFNKIAGTSAGAIIASLLAVGYSGKEIEEMVCELQFDSFLKTNWIGRIPFLGKGINIWFHSGMYSGNQIEAWVDDKLKIKGITLFGDLPQGKLKVIASDITNYKMLVLPDDLKLYGIDWRTFSIAKAVRMSSSIPYFFQPYVLKGRNKKSFILDGSLLSGFPIWLFDTEKVPRWPTFGFRLKDLDKELEFKEKVKGPFSMLRALLVTMLEAHDKRYIKKNDAVRTIFLPVEGIKTTDFEITFKQKKHLIEQGREEAKKFFNQWNFSQYINHYRQERPGPRIKKV
jgi:NTE family protein